MGKIVFGLLLCAALGATHELACNETVSLGTIGRPTINKEEDVIWPPCSYTATAPEGYAVKLECYPEQRFGRQVINVTYCDDNFIEINDQRFCPSETEPHNLYLAGTTRAGNVILVVSATFTVTMNCTYSSFRICECGERIPASTFFRSDVLLMRTLPLLDVVQAGSLISEKWVLTTSRTLLSSVYVATPSKVKLSDIKSVQNHASLLLMLVELETPLTWSDTLGPACLPRGLYEVEDNNQATHWRRNLLENNRFTRNVLKTQCGVPGTKCTVNEISIIPGSGLITGENNILFGVKDLDLLFQQYKYQTIGTTAIIEWIDSIANPSLNCTTIF